MELPVDDLSNAIQWMSNDVSDMYRLKIENKSWEPESLVTNNDYWKFKIKENSSNTYKQWCWLSTIWHSPNWSDLNDIHLNQWHEIWSFLYLNIDDIKNINKHENTRWEIKWMELYKESIDLINVQNLVDYKKEIHLSDDLFWRLLKIIIKEKPILRNEVLSLWKNNPPRDVGQVMLSLATEFENDIEPPIFWINWLSETIKDSHKGRALHYPTFQNQKWNEQLCDTFVSSTSDGDASLPMHAPKIWKLIPTCSYKTRLKIALSFLEGKPLENSSKRWPIDYYEMRRHIESIPNTQFSKWNTEPWLAGFLHILPEFANLFVFHNLLPVTPLSALQMVNLSLSEEKTPKLENTQFDNTIFNLDL